MLLDLVKNLSFVYLPIVSCVRLRLPVEYKDSHGWFDEHQGSEERVLKKANISAPHAVTSAVLSVDYRQVLVARVVELVALQVVLLKVF